MASAALQLCGMLAQAAEYASELPPPPPVGGPRQAQLGLCDLKAVPPRGTSHYNMLCCSMQDGGQHPLAALYSGLLQQLLPNIQPVWSVSEGRCVPSPLAAPAAEALAGACVVLKPRAYLQLVLQFVSSAEGSQPSLDKLQVSSPNASSPANVCFSLVTQRVAAAPSAQSAAPAGSSPGHQCCSRRTVGGH